jgi:hypothetical protein
VKIAKRRKAHVSRASRSMGAKLRHISRMLGDSRVDGHDAARCRQCAAMARERRP